MNRDDAYRKANPLGGPATMFRTIAGRLEAGEDYYAVLEDYGLVHSESAPSVRAVTEEVRRLRAGPVINLGRYDRGWDDALQRVELFTASLPSETAPVGCKEKDSEAPTPRTDALVEKLSRGGDIRAILGALDERAALSRQLERELAAAQSATQRSVELEEGYDYRTHEGWISRVQHGTNITELLGPGGWTPAL